MDDQITKEGMAIILSEIRNDIKWIKEELKEMKNKTNEQLKEHDERIQKLEEFKYKVMGALIVLYFVISGIIIYLR